MGLRMLSKFIITPYNIRTLQSTSFVGSSKPDSVVEVIQKINNIIVFKKEMMEIFSPSLFSYSPVLISGLQGGNCGS